MKEETREDRWTAEVEVGGELPGKESPPPKNTGKVVRLTGYGERPVLNDEDRTRPSGTAP